VDLKTRLLGIFDEDGGKGEDGEQQRKQAEDDNHSKGSFLLLFA
jgi:hypothetical protein